MSNQLILDFDKIREAGEPLPDIAVADFIPLKGDGEDSLPDARAVKGIVLELNRPETLNRGFILPAGHGILYVRLPTGETLVERVYIGVSEGQVTGKLKLKLAGQKEALSPTHQFVHAHSAPRRAGMTESVRSQTPRSERSRWSMIKFDQSERSGQSPRTLSSFLEPFANRVVDERQGNRGIVKLSSAPRTFAPSVSGLAKRVQFDSLLVGEVRAAKPTKLYGARDDLHAQWKTPISQTKNERFFALTFEAGNEPVPLQVACVPGVWKTYEDNKSASLTMHYVTEYSTRGQRGGRVVVSIEDPKFKALLQFMQTGDLASSMSLLSQAMLALNEKFHNPYAAAAGGYVLTHAGYQGGHTKWGRWVHNLAKYFPTLPDGHILLANLILQGPSKIKERIPDYSTDTACALALRSILEAVRRGPPLYRFGLRMLSSNIAILNHLIKVDHPDRLRLEAAADYVRKLSMRVDRHQPFCVFDVGGELNE